MTDRITVFILCRDRPLSLWASLDSLYRHTKTPANFVILDNNSQDPLVAKIVGAFDRRGLFSEIVVSPRNDPNILVQTVERYASRLGPYFAYVEGDVAIEPRGRCWLEIMREIMNARPRLAMLGSQVDKSDFVDPDVAKILSANRSPERWSYTPPGTLGTPHNPPGRLLMLRRAAIEEVGWVQDGLFHKWLTERGWEGAITGDVVHRHLGLQNFFDYPDFDVEARRQFWERFGRRDGGQ